MPTTDRGHVLAVQDERLDSAFLLTLGMSRIRIDKGSWNEGHDLAYTGSDPSSWAFASPKLM